MKHKDDIKSLNIGKNRLFGAEGTAKFFVGPLSTRYNEIWAAPPLDRGGRFASAAPPTDFGQVLPWYLVGVLPN